MTESSDRWRTSHSGGPTDIDFGTDFDLLVMKTVLQYQGAVHSCFIAVGPAGDRVLCDCDLRATNLPPA